MVILVGQIQDSDLDFHVALGETIAGKEVELPEVAARFVDGKPLVALSPPIGLELAEEAAGQVVIGKKRGLVQGGLVDDPARFAGNSRHLRVVSHIRRGQMVGDAGGQFVADELVHVDPDVPFLVIHGLCARNDDETLLQAGLENLKQ